MSIYGGFYLVRSDTVDLSAYSADVDTALGGHYADVEQRPDGASVYRYIVSAVATMEDGQRCALDLVSPPSGDAPVYIAADDPAWIPAPVGP